MGLVEGDYSHRLVDHKPLTSKDLNRSNQQRRNSLGKSFVDTWRMYIEEALNWMLIVREYVRTMDKLSLLMKKIQT